MEDSRMEYLPPGFITVKIKNLQGHQFEIQTDSNVTISNLKIQIESKAQIPVSTQKLIFLGRVLKDEMTLLQYDIKEGSVIHLVPSNKNIFFFTPGNQPEEQTFSDNSGSSSPENTIFDSNTTQINNQNQGPTTNVNIHAMRVRMNPSEFFRMMQSSNSSGVPPNPGKGCNFSRRMGHWRRGEESSSSSNSETEERPHHRWGNYRRWWCSRGNGGHGSNGGNSPEITAMSATPTTTIGSNNSNNNTTPNSPAQSSIQQPQMQTPLSQLDLELDGAISGGNVDKVIQLVEQGNANINRGGLVHRACMFGHQNVVSYLVRKGSKPDIKLANGETCVHTCAFYGQKEILEFLIKESGANIWERTNDGKTALMLAVYNNHRSVSELLLQFGASVFDNDIHGATPLMLASQKGNKEMVELLLRYGSRIDVRDSRGRTPLHFSASGGYPNITSILLAAGAPVNAINCNKETALHYAAYHGKKECIILLASRGADINSCSNSGTPIQLANAKGFNDIVDLLIQLGATLPS